MLRGMVAEEEFSGPSNDKPSSSRRSAIGSTGGVKRLLDESFAVEVA